jgi:hypothetical protein
MIGNNFPESSGPRYARPACQLQTPDIRNHEPCYLKHCFSETPLQNKKLAELSRKFLFRVKNYKFRFQPISALHDMFIGHLGKGERPCEQGGSAPESKPKKNRICMFLLTNFRTTCDWKEVGSNLATTDQPAAQASTH